MPTELLDYTRKVIIFVAIVGLAFVLAKLSHVLVMVFGGVVLAAVLLTLTGLLRRVVPLPHGVALAVVLVLLIGGLSTLLALFGAQAASELATLVETMPAAAQSFQDWVDTTRLGPVIHEQIEALRGNVNRLMGTAGAMAMSLTSGLLELFLVLVGGIYMAAQPQLYRKGALKLVPRSVRLTTAEALDASGRALQMWLGGQLVAMLLVGALTGIALWMLGVPAAFALALIAFLLDFVPIIGPIVAAVPGILLGFTVSPKIGLATLVVYIVIQQIESNIIQPLIQQRAVELPPALLLFALFGFGALYGLPGLLLAAPLTVFVYVLVKKLYVRELLDTETSVPGEESESGTER
ncbi:AI-2E family transporter [Luteimonas sp. MHLX1A]|uniref:AI-2E family transporter n=1 Tax=Alterluteimonas muca TaxID=2878684 RepID=UPI001E5928E4|nr:AI-2E family transporter [Luteimonas sp. MHLX1A]MCD9046578.1 AI-2E family transporter [Luteimonas sp. MHLX1A]